MQRERPIVLSIAGFDPCGGAGILADIKTFEQLKTQGMAIITAQTIQTENQFFRLNWIDIDEVKHGIKILMQQYVIDVIKIGIVPNTIYLKAIIETIKTMSSKAFIVWDPILKSSSGYTFFQEADLLNLEKTISMIDLITPNIEEYIILQQHIKTASVKALLVKGGHRKKNIGTDILYTNENEIIFPSFSISKFSKHGSGCVLSAAISAQIAIGHSLEEACRNGKIYVEQLLKSHPSLLGYHYNA